MTATPPASKPAGCLSVGLLVLGVLAVIGISREAIKSPTTTAMPAAATTPPIPGDAVAKPVNTLFVWEDGKDPSTFAVEGFVLRLSSKPGPIAPIPVLDVQAPDGTTFHAEGTPGLSTASAQIGVGRLDQSSTENQVLFTTFNGGAHCCAEIQAIDRVKGEWKLVDIAGQDGDQLRDFPSDLDGDGKPEFKLEDDRFLYAFASYAQSWAPPLVKSLVGGEIRDLSAEPRFRKVFADFLAKSQAECEGHNNGACPGFVAAAARADKFAWAWSVMMKSYDRASTWELPTACSERQDNGTCADGADLKFGTYPEALRWFLGDAGYMPPVYIPQNGAVGPTFDCAKVTAATLKLVCGVPELATADRELAFLYWRVLALSADPSAIVESERAFILSRNNAPADAFSLLRLYQARLETLRSLLDVAG